MFTILPPFRAEAPDRFLNREKQPQHIQVEVAVKMLLGHLLKRKEFVDPGNVDQDVDAPKGLDGFVKQTLDARFFRQVACTASALPAPTLISETIRSGPLRLEA
jgi:hypothetical protein